MDATEQRRKENGKAEGGALTGQAPTGKRGKRLLVNLGLAAGTFVLCVAVFEVVLRCFGYGNLEIYEPDPALYWKLKPNQNCYTKVDHKRVHINSLGTRGPEFQPEKPPGTYRILCLGDSRTFGWGLSESETYSDRLRKLMQEKVGAGRTVEVINAGVNAWSFPQMLVYFRGTALKYKPDVVVLAEANLWTQFSEKNSPEFVKKFMSRVRLKNFLRHFAIYHYVVEVQLKDFYSRYRSKFIPVDPKQDTMFKEQQQNDPEAVFRSAIEAICRVAQTNDMQPVLLYLPMLGDYDATTAAGVLKVKRELSQKLHVPLVDMTPDAKPLGKELYLDADPVHFNARGNELVARRLLEAVKANP